MGVAATFALGVVGALIAFALVPSSAGCSSATGPERHALLARERSCSGSRWWSFSYGSQDTRTSAQLRGSRRQGCLSSLESFVDGFGSLGDDRTVKACHERLAGAPLGFFIGLTWRMNERTISNCLRFV